ncbi:MAG: hypothetical protein K0R57_53 [Paenibacillaceae bacterium]|jgi:hypothetical protein|nr:hypothetical protein [Paenibacillaceae bacterium]
MKWLSGLMKMTAAAIFLTFVSLYATWTVVQTYLDKVLAHYQIAGDMKKIEFSDFLASVGGNLNIMKQPVSKQQGGPEAAQGNTGALSEATKPVGGSISGGSTIGTGAAGSSPTKGQETGQGSSSPHNEASTGATATDPYREIDDALPVWNQSSGESYQAQQQSGQQAYGEADKQIVSAESLTTTKDKISNDDKMKLFSLLISKLPPTEVQAISVIMEDGITQQELLELDTIMQKYLTDEEYRQVIEILERYQ